ncbi:MAG: 16S rRNA (cytosine(1402)-N(4))-methyltransferase RsmH [Candidatus Falkowbacteria bacterium]|nr:16S rRNA (cytosine(1402)-N(4))-methyltransferase RsmH [Candidatus Falkowbacteria bacterium]
MYHHLPVMLKEVLEYLQPKSGGNFIDGTLGGASYTLALAAAVGPTGRILATDLDELALENARQKLTDLNLNNVVLARTNFKNIKEIVAAKFPATTKFQGIVLDLGLSSAQLEDETRGFSFQGERPLDMAFGDELKLTETIVNKYSLLDLTRIFREYGEERFAYQIAKKIVEVRRRETIKSTKDLVDIILSALPARFRASRLNPATRVFQALRMETNQELESLRAVLPLALDLLSPAGRLVIVSFHSGEDRIVKNFFRDHNRQELEILTKKPLGPSPEETNANPRARSAKLRAARRIQTRSPN